MHCTCCRVFRQGFYLEGLYMALDSIREREGFLLKEIEEFREAFKLFDKDRARASSSKSST
eukprot:3831145-Amphidinium_carterae.1